MRETRAHVIEAHVSFALRHCGIDQANFADDVVRVYHERTPLPARGIAFREHVRGTDPYAVLRANEQLLFRMLRTDGAVRLAVELEEAIVLALPERFRHECLRELNARYGLMAAPLPEVEGAEVTTAVGNLTRDFGECLAALARTVSDGRLETSDAKDAPAVIRELDDVIAGAISLRAAHQSLLQPRGSHVPPLRNPGPPADAAPATAPERL